MLIVESGIIMAVSCCMALSFSTLDIASVNVCSLFLWMQVAILWAFLKPLINILIVAASFVKLHLLASVLNWWIYAARDFNEVGGESMNVIIAKL